jgi:hypothetical protein
VRAKAHEWSLKTTEGDTVFSRDVRSALGVPATEARTGSPFSAALAQGDVAISILAYTMIQPKPDLHPGRRCPDAGARPGGFWITDSALPGSSPVQMCLTNPPLYAASFQRTGEDNPPSFAPTGRRSRKENKHAWSCT